MLNKITVLVMLFLISICYVGKGESQHYTDDNIELISLDLKGMDIRDVLKILSQKSGLNIIADKDVQGTVSLYVKDVDVKGALDILVITNDLAYEEEGSLIRIMTDKKYERLHGEPFRARTVTEIVKLNYATASNVVKALMNMKTNIGKVIGDDASNTIVLIDTKNNVERMKKAISEMDVLLVTEVFNLDYAKAESIKEKLEKAVSEKVGSIRFDERTNKLVVTDTPKKIEEFRKIIEAFDEKTREVMIDANIIQVTLSDKYSYGIDWADIAKMGDVTLTFDSALTTKLSNTTPNTLTVATAKNYTTVISLLSMYGETNVLSRPRITVNNNEEAKILVGSKEVYVTSEVTTTEGGTYHTADHVQFVDVGVRLAVTPEINREGYIKMKIKPEVSSTDATKTVTLTNPDGSTRTIVPYVTTSEAETTVLVKDNTTIVIGGLMKDTVTEYTDKIPLLGDIPLVGRLFSTKGKGKEKTELVIFLTPHIIEGNVITEEAKSYLDEWEKKEKKAEIKSLEDIEREKRTHEIERQKALKDKKEKEKKLQAQGVSPVNNILSGHEQESVVKKGEKGPASSSRTMIAKKEKWTPFPFFSEKKTPSKKIESETKRKKTPEPEKKYEVHKSTVPPQDEKKTPYEEYFFKVRDEIINLSKSQDVSGIKGEVELEFTLDRDGYLVRGPIVLNKPNLTLVRAAVNCVKEAAPFPPFPKTIKEKEAVFTVTLRYE